MRLNTLKPANGAKREKTRVGRGIGSGFGKTSGRGGKGQTARAGGKVRRGFEGGQNPLQRRLPKVGFKSQAALYFAEIKLSELNKVDGNDVDMLTLKQSGVIKANVESAKIILSGEVKKAVTVRGMKVTAGARSAIEAAGGKVEG